MEFYACYFKFSLIIISNLTIYTYYNLPGGRQNIYKHITQWYSTISTCIWAHLCWYMVGGNSEVPGILVYKVWCMLSIMSTLSLVIKNSFFFTISLWTSSRISNIPESLYSETYCMLTFCELPLIKNFHATTYEYRREGEKNW